MTKNNLRINLLWLTVPETEAIVAGEKPAAQEAEIGVGKEEGKRKRGKETGSGMEL